MVLVATLISAATSVSKYLRTNSPDLNDPICRTWTIRVVANKQVQVSVNGQNIEALAAAPLRRAAIGP